MDLERVPFSCYGSYMTVSKRNNSLYLRSVSSASPSDLVFRISLLYKKAVVPFKINACETIVKLESEKGYLEIFFLNEKQILMRTNGEDLGVRFDEIAQAHSCNYVHDLIVEDTACKMINCYKNWTRHLVQIKEGQWELDMLWKAEQSDKCVLDFYPVNGKVEFSLKEIYEEKDIAITEWDFDKDYEKRVQVFESYLEKMPVLSEEFTETRRFNAYVQWSGIVSPRGLLKRPTMFMSKNWMINVWAWDHCFNALGICNAFEELAWDQYMTMFDYQDECGLLPDFLSDTSKFVQCCKPPIHGFTLSELMKNMEVCAEKLKEIYPKLCAWTNWWFKHRDGNKNGLCEYWHGNDSGWDNGTVFSVTPVVESPDLAAFLVVQADVLSDVAEKIGLEDESKEWKEKAKKWAGLLIDNFFVDDLPVAINPSNNEKIICDSLLPFISLIAGKYLPKKIIDKMVSVLKSDKFLTEFGFASESLSSPLYKEDGYWRGAIWPPATCLMVYALDKVGEKEFAKDVAMRFCKMVSSSGSAENFSALTGKALRDNGYTWSASIFNYFAVNYLGERKD